MAALRLALVLLGAAAALAMPLVEMQIALDRIPKTANGKQPTLEEWKKMADGYWVSQVAPADDLTKMKPSDKQPSLEEWKKMADGYWVSQVAPADDLTKMKPAEKQPSLDEWKKMADGYWVSQVAPADDLTKMKPVGQKDGGWKPANGQSFRLSYGATERGLLSGDEYMVGGKQMEQYGFAKTFGSDMDAATKFLADRSGWDFPSWDILKGCAASTSCPYAWMSDPELQGHNATVVEVLHMLPGPSTIRCHAHPTGTWCHDKTEDFNKGYFYVMRVQPVDQPDVTRIGLAMCHEWPDEYKEYFEHKNGLCHAMPVGLVVPIRQH